MSENLKVQGFILIDVDVVALNNAGKDTASNFDNAVATKVISKNGKKYVYVSGQAWRYWWRETLQHTMGWKMSPIIRDDEKKIVFTNADPTKYADDDVFGYMHAAKEVVINKNGKPKPKDITVTRVSPLKNSVIVSVVATQLVKHWSSMARQEGDSVPYTKQEYSAIMKGMFSLDLQMIGTFSNYNKTGYKNLSDKLKEEAIQGGAEIIVDPFMPEQKLIRLPIETRVSRAIDTIKALKTIAGGAMQTNNLGDVTPKFIILATTTTGNHPFSHIVKADGAYDEIAVLNIEGLKEVLIEYKDTFRGKIFIGKRSGFFDSENEDLQKLQKEFEDILVVGPVNAMIDSYCIQLTEQMKG